MHSLLFLFGDAWVGMFWFGGLVLGGGGFKACEGGGERCGACFVFKVTSCLVVCFLLDGVPCR